MSTTLNSLYGFYVGDKIAKSNYNYQSYGKIRGKYMLPQNFLRDFKLRESIFKDYALIERKAPYYKLFFDIDLKKNNNEYKEIVPNYDEVIASIISKIIVVLKENISNVEANGQLEYIYCDKEEDPDEKTKREKIEKKIEKQKEDQKGENQTEKKIFQYEYSPYGVHLYFLNLVVNKELHERLIKEVTDRCYNDEDYKNKFNFRRWELLIDDSAARNGLRLPYFNSKGAYYKKNEEKSKYSLKIPSKTQQFISLCLLNTDSTDFNFDLTEQGVMLLKTKICIGLSENVNKSEKIVKKIRKIKKEDNISKTCNTEEENKLENKTSDREEHDKLERKTYKFKCVHSSRANTYKLINKKDQATQEEDGKEDNKVIGKNEGIVEQKKELDNIHNETVSKIRIGGKELTINRKEIVEENEKSEKHVGYTMRILKITSSNGNIKKVLVLGKKVNLMALNINQYNKRFGAIENGGKAYDLFLAENNNKNDYKTPSVITSGRDRFIIFKYDEEIVKIGQLYKYNIIIMAEDEHFPIPSERKSSDKFNDLEFIYGFGVKVMEMPVELKIWLFRNRFDNYGPEIKGQFKGEYNVLANDIQYFNKQQLVQCLMEMNVIDPTIVDNYRYWAEIGSMLCGVDVQYWDVFDKWSSGGKKYKKKENEKIWNSFVPKKSIMGLNKFFEEKRICRNVIRNIRDIVFLTVKPNELDQKQYVDFNIGGNTNHVFLIKAGTGTGKTTFANKLINQLNINSNYKVLVLVSRISLAMQMLKSIVIGDEKLNLYSKVIEEGGDINACSNLVNQIDSIIKLNPKQWESSVVFLDEVESLLKYIFLAETLKNKRKEVIDKFVKILKNAAYIIACDAHLSDASVIFFKMLGMPYYLYQNTYKNYKGVEAISYVKKEGIMQVIINKLKKKESFVCALDTLESTEYLYQELVEHCKRTPELNGFEKNILIYTGKHGNPNDLSNVNETWDGKIVLFNSKIIYGLDFNNKVKIDVFLIATSCRCMDALQFMQQINRVRNIGKIHYYISDRYEPLKFASYRDFEEYLDVLIDTYENMTVYSNSIMSLCCGNFIEGEEEREKERHDMEGIESVKKPTIKKIIKRIKKIKRKENTVMDRDYTYSLITDKYLKSIIDKCKNQGRESAIANSNGNSSESNINPNLVSGNESSNSNDSNINKINDVCIINNDVIYNNINGIDNDGANDNNNKGKNDNIIGNICDNSNNENDNNLININGCNDKSDVCGKPSDKRKKREDISNSNGNSNENSDDNDANSIYIINKLRNLKIITKSNENWKLFDEIYKPVIYRFLYYDYVLKCAPVKQFQMLLEDKGFVLVDAPIKPQFDTCEMIKRNVIAEMIDSKKIEILQCVAKNIEDLPMEYKTFGEDVVKKCEILNIDYQNEKELIMFKEYLLKDNKFKSHFKMCELFKKDIYGNAKMIDDASNNLKIDNIENIPIKLNIIKDIENALGIKRLEIDSEKITLEMKQQTIKLSEKNESVETACIRWNQKIKIMQSVFKITAKERINELEKFKYGAWYLQLIYLYKHFGSNKIISGEREGADNTYYYETNWEFVKENLCMYSLRNINYKTIHVNILNKCDLEVEDSYKVSIEHSCEYGKIMYIKAKKSGAEIERMSFMNNNRDINMFT